MKYGSNAAVQIHLMIASPQRTSLTFPQRDQLAINERTRSMEILRLIETVSCGRWHSRDLLLDALPLMIYMLNPKLRPVNAQLFNAQEIVALEQVIMIMADFGLKFNQKSDTSTEQRMALFEPAIDFLSQFELEGQSKQTMIISETTKELISDRLHRVKSKRRANEPSKKRRNVEIEALLSRSLISSTLQSGVRFKFNEGCSNAIRRLIRMQNLID